MGVSNSHFAFVADEARIICIAANPIAQTANLFIHGNGQHERPPLYDFILHGWLQITGGRMRLLRQ
jgi:hypothetical protein